MVCFGSMMDIISSLNQQRWRGSLFMADTPWKSFLAIENTRFHGKNMGRNI